MSAKNNNTFTDMVQRMAVLGMLPAGYSSSLKAKSKPKPKARTAKPNPRVLTEATIEQLENKLRALPDHDDALCITDFLPFDAVEVFAYLDHDIPPAKRVVDEMTPEEDAADLARFDRMIEADTKALMAEGREVVAEVDAAPKTVRVTLDTDDHQDDLAGCDAVFRLAKVTEVIMDDGLFRHTTVTVSPSHTATHANGLGDIATWQLDDGYYIPQVFPRDGDGETHLGRFPTIEIKDGKRRDLSRIEWIAQQQRMADQAYAADIVAEPVPQSERKLLAEPPVVVSEAVKAEPAPEIEVGQVLPVGNTPSDEDLLAAGVVTMQRINKWRQREWNDWLPSGIALLAAQRIVVRESGSNTGVYDRKLNTAFGVKLKEVGFVIMPNERSTLLKIMKILPEVEAWRSLLTDADRQRWNSPVIVWREFRKYDAKRLANERGEPVVAKRKGLGVQKLTVMLRDVSYNLSKARVEIEVMAKALRQNWNHAHAEEINMPMGEEQVRSQIQAGIRDLPLPEMELAEAT